MATQVTLNSGSVDSAGSLALKTNGTTTAVTINSSQGVEFNAGTAALPSITTTGDTNTGIFFPAADTIAFTEGGVEAARFDSSGNFGIGTTSPAAKLDVNGIATATSYSSGLSGVTSTLAPSASETILTVTAFSMYLVYGGGTGNTSAMGMGIAQANGVGDVTVTQLSGTATGFTLSSSGSNIQITNNTASQAYRWKAVRLINLNG